MRPYRSSSFWYWCKLCAFHDNITRWGTTRERWVLNKNLQLIIFVSWTYVAPMHPTSFPLWPFIPSRVKSSLLACLCLTRYATIVWQEHVMWRNQTMVVKDYPLLHSYLWDELIPLAADYGGNNKKKGKKSTVIIICTKTVSSLAIWLVDMFLNLLQEMPPYYRTKKRHLTLQTKHNSQLDCQLSW